MFRSTFGRTDQKAPTSSRPQTWEERVAQRLKNFQQTRIVGDATFSQNHILNSHLSSLERGMDVEGEHDDFLSKRRGEILGRDSHGPVTHADTSLSDGKSDSVTREEKFAKSSPTRKRLMIDPKEYSTRFEEFIHEEESDDETAFRQYEEAAFVVDTESSRSGPKPSFKSNDSPRKRTLYEDEDALETDDDDVVVKPGFGTESTNSSVMEQTQSQQLVFDMEGISGQAEDGDQVVLSSGTETSTSSTESTPTVPETAFLVSLNLAPVDRSTSQDPINLGAVPDN